VYDEHTMQLFETITSFHGAAIGEVTLTPTIVLLLALLLLTLVLIGIALRNTAAVRLATYPVYDYTVKKAEEEAKKIVRDAEHEAKAIREKAEKDAGDTLAKREQESARVNEHYKEQLQALAEHNKKLLEHYTTLAHDTYREFGAAVKRQSQEGETIVKKEIEHLLGELRDEHAKLRRHFSEKFQERLDGELSAVRESVTRYREAQLRMLDKRIIALVERAAALVLQKEMTVKEHTDMIFKSLEEAKKEGVI